MTNRLDRPTLPELPRRLRAADPSWTETTDVCVIGSGIAGLTTALHLREAGLHVTVVTKVDIDEGSTRWAQGGIAAVLDPLDSPAAHAHDTQLAGVGLCDPKAVSVMVTEGPDRLRELIHTGARFDRHDDGSLMLTREGGHRARRIVHAGGDATGAEVQRALHDAVHRDPWIRVIDHALVLDLLSDSTGRVCGVSLHVLGEGSEDGVGGVLARAVVLATGGMGQIFASTTNPAVSTGDGVAAALRAGAAVTDVEFVQFHPTALFLPADLSTRDRQPLISEALRGEGAHLVDGDGDRFMLGEHELAELAPRDVVAKGAMRRMRADGTDHVWLDARHLGVEMLESRFPTIVASCRAIGIDPVSDLIPVAPAAHYASGGVRTDLQGRSSVPGLYACGEVACTGVHGANRLASNSLLEALVFSRRIAADIASGLPAQTDPVASRAGSWAVSTRTRAPLRQAMSAGAGVLRSAESLAQTAEVVTELGGQHSDRPRTDAWEATNLMTIAAALLASAYARRETRGCHWREDFDQADQAWIGHLVSGLGTDGAVSTTREQL